MGTGQGESKNVSSSATSTFVNSVPVSQRFRSARRGRKNGGNAQENLENWASWKQGVFSLLPTFSRQYPSIHILGNFQSKRYSVSSRLEFYWNLSNSWVVKVFLDKKLESFQFREYWSWFVELNWALVHSLAIWVISVSAVKFSKVSDDLP